MVARRCSLRGLCYYIVHTAIYGYLVSVQVLWKPKYQSKGRGPMYVVRPSRARPYERKAARANGQTPVRPSLARYGISGYGVSRPGIQNKKGFCIKINSPEGNYWILRIGLMGSLISLHNLSYFVSLVLKLHNRKCHSKHSNIFLILGLKANQGLLANTRC